MGTTATIDYRFRLRRRSAASWASLNEVLLDSEIGLESDTRKYKIGDGTTAWNALGYYGADKATIGGAETFVIAAGTAQAITAALTPALAALTDGMQIKVRAFLANTAAAPTLKINALTAYPITKQGGVALVAGDIHGLGHELLLRYVAATPAFELLNPAVSGGGSATWGGIGGSLNDQADLKAALDAKQNVPGGSSIGDDFALADSYNYTVFSKSAASFPFAVGVVSATATNGAQAVMIRNGVIYADGEVTATSTQCNDGGLAIRVKDADNYYLLTVNDASSSTSPNSMSLYAQVANVFTSLGSATIAFTRGTSHTFSLSASGTSLVAKFDGTPVISVTDSSIAGTGFVGLRQNTTTASLYQAMQWG